MMTESFRGSLHSPGSPELRPPGPGCRPPGRRMVPLSARLLFARRKDALASTVDLILFVQVVVAADRLQNRLRVQLGIEHHPGEAALAEVLDQRVRRPDISLVQVPQVSSVPDHLL